MNDDTSRLGSIDAARWLCCFAVAFLHSTPGLDVTSPSSIAVLISIACRGAVPFFFVTSGYFAKSGSQIRTIRRLAPVYISWLIIYSILANRIDQLQSFRTWATGGVAYHLWFIPTLMFTLIVVPNTVKYCGLVATGLLCTTLALCSLGFDAYRFLLIIPAIDGTRLMMAPLIVYIGIVIRRTEISLSPLVSLSIFMVAWVVAVSEETAIAHLSHSPLVSHANVTSTILMGPALFLCAKSLSRASIWLSALGKVTLGVYAAHLLFLQLIVTAVGSGGIPRQIAISIATVLCATIASLGLSRFKFTKWLV
jgi:surface polysaccharide O-acyltransferase-like enzyme